MSLATRYKMFWVACITAMFGVAVWKNSISYPAMKWYNRLAKAAVDTTLVVLMAVFYPALLVMYVVLWLTSPFKNKHAQVAAGFGGALLLGHLAGVVFEVVIIAGIFAVDLVTGQVLARMRKHQVAK